MTIGSLFAKAGAKIYDVDGTLVATLIRDAIVGIAVTPDHFEFEDGSEPAIGERLPDAISLFFLNGPYA